MNKKKKKDLDSLKSNSTSLIQNKSVNKSKIQPVNVNGDYDITNVCPISGWVHRRWQKTYEFSVIEPEIRRGNK